MGWDKGTEIMDAAVRAMTMAAAEVFQVAAGLEGAKTPGLANWLNDDPANPAKLDDQLRRGVALVAEQLLNCGWDSPEEAEDFERFSQEMLGHDYVTHALWLSYQASTAEEPEHVAMWEKRIREHEAKGWGNHMRSHNTKGRKA